mmetsp:Transcript_76319/g.223783  ORF Transcript_76319/g.223783 Transcript_76319/m.223783 type:complete len:223 (+) Transcript_76319:152-820(+)
MRCTHFSARSGDSATRARRVLGFVADFFKIDGSPGASCRTSNARVSASSISVRPFRTEHKHHVLWVFRSETNLSLQALSSVTEQTTASLRSMASAGSTSLVSEKRYIRCRARTAQYRFCNCELNTAMSHPSMSGCTGSFEKATRGKGSTEISTCFTALYQAVRASSEASSTSTISRVFSMYSSTVMIVTDALFLPTFLGATWSPVFSMMRLTATVRTLSELR